MPRPPGLNSLSQILGQVMKNLSLDKALLQAHVQSHWDHVVGPAIARHAQPDQLRAGKLYVHVDSPLWLQELTMVRPALIEKINAALGKKGRIDDLVLRIGAIGSDASLEEIPGSLRTVSKNRKLPQ